VQAAIRVENIKKHYGDVVALDGVSLEAETGKILGLLGPNGAGKTTLVRILTTLLHPDSGNAWVNGVDVIHHPEGVRSVIGLAGQYPAVDEQLTGTENLVMVGELYHLGRRTAKQRAKELLQQFSLEDAADRPVKTYSGGMRRRLDLAASIVAKPDILFLDEPTTGLDPRTRKDLWNVIRDLVADGATLLLTTQYLEEADQLADRIVLIDHGKLIADGTSNELKSQFASDVLEVTIEDLQDIERASDALDALNIQHPNLDRQTGLITLAIDDGPKTLITAIRALDEANIAIVDIKLRHPSLDDVFLALTEDKNTIA